MPLSDPFTNLPPEVGTISDAQPLQRPRVVILGSSTAVGVGASSPALSWAGRLTTALEPLGLAVVNVSVSGTDMNWALAQFPIVAALKPAVVILATSPWNCGLGGGDPAGAFDDYVAKATRLAGLFEQIGARVIWFAGYPKNGQPTLSDKLLPMLYDALEKWALWDCYGQTDNAGEWRAGFSDDGTHPSTAGHGAMFDGITLSALFAEPQPRHVFAGWKLDALDGSVAPLKLSLQRSADHVTAAMWFKFDPTAITARVFIALDSARRLRNPFGPFQFADGGANDADSGLSPGSGVWSHIAITYDRPLNQLALFVNGVADRVWTCAAGATAQAEVSFMGRLDLGAANCVTGVIARPQVWRTKLSAQQLTRVYLGGKILQSLVLDASLSGDVSAGRAVNHASGLDALAVNGTFTAQQTFRDVVS